MSSSSSSSTTGKPKSPLEHIVPILLCGLSVPLSIFMWLGNLAFNKLTRGPEYDENAVIPPTRWLFSTVSPVSLMIFALRKKGVDKSGALLGVISATIFAIANYAFFMCLVVFFFSSSKATKFRNHMKRKIEEDHKGGWGRRNWTQVLCNAGMATQLALLYLLDCGSGERPINFSTMYRSSWLGIAVMSSFACCNGDTWASEIGSVLSKSDPFLITTRKRVPRGTNGGVSIIGLIVSFLGGIFVGIAYFLTVMYTVDASQLVVSPAQWPIILFGGLAGFIGSLIDSFLGATLQYSGIDKSGRIVAKPDKNVDYISGLNILDNHSVNLISSVLTGVIMPTIALNCWPEI